MKGKILGVTLIFATLAGVCLFMFGESEDQTLAFKKHTLKHETLGEKFTFKHQSAEDNCFIHDVQVCEKHSTAEDDALLTELVQQTHNAREFLEKLKDSKVKPELKQCIVDSTKKCFSQEKHEQGEDFDGQDFDGEDFDGEDFDGEDFEGENFEGEDFDGEDFDGEDFDGEDFDGEDFDGEDFDGEDFDGEDFDREDFDGEDFDGEDFDGEDFDGEDFDGEDFDEE